MSNNKKNKQEPKRKLFGRNIFTFVFIAVCIVVLFFIFYIPYSYISTYVKTKPTPFDSNVSDTMKKNVGLTAASGEEEIKAKMTDGATSLKGKDFKDLDLKFYAKTYDQEKGTVVFSATLNWNEETTKLVGDGSLKNLTSSYNLYMYVSIASAWVTAHDEPFAQYSSLQQFNISKPTGDNTKGTTYARSSISVGELDHFPSKTNIWTDTFPTRVTVLAPTAYVYLYFVIENSNKTTTEKRYILEYDYSEYHTSETVGGIIEN